MRAFIIAVRWDLADESQPTHQQRNSSHEVKYVIFADSPQNARLKFEEVVGDRKKILEIGPTFEIDGMDNVLIAVIPDHVWQQVTLSQP